MEKQLTSHHSLMPSFIHLEVQGYLVIKTTATRTCIRTSYTHEQGCNVSNENIELYMSWLFTPTLTRFIWKGSSSFSKPPWLVWLYDNVTAIKSYGFHHCNIYDVFPWILPFSTNWKNETSPQDCIYSTKKTLQMPSPISHSSASCPNPRRFEIFEVLQLAIGTGEISSQSF